MTPARHELLRARSYLSRVAEPPAPALAELTAELGPIHAARRVAQGAVCPGVAAETGARRDDDRAAQDLASARRFGARLVVPEDDEWPASAFTCFDPGVAAQDPRHHPPLALWVRGPARLNAVGEAAVAVVGARAATGYGEHVATDLGHGLAGRGFAVVSGAAHGVDGAAHRGALAAEGTSVAVQACGLDRVYPAGHARLLDRIGQAGAVVTEYPPGVRPARHRFLVRNRLIAALSAGTVVVEAGARSGARSTAGAAAVFGRVVMAVPGPVTSALSVGCHQLVREEHALLVTRFEEVAEAVSRIGTELAPVQAGPERSTDGLSRDQLTVYDALPARAPRHAEQLVRPSGVPLDRVRAALPLLQLHGLVGYGPGGWRRTA